jgi:hypothetical protein
MDLLPQQRGRGAAEAEPAYYARAFRQPLHRPTQAAFAAMRASSTLPRRPAPGAASSSSAGPSATAEPPPPPMPPADLPLEEAQVEV